MSKPPPSLASAPVTSRRPRAPYRRARRWLFAALVLGTTLLGGCMMLDIVRAGGITALELGILALFWPTFGWISISFWNASLGFVLRLLRRDPTSLRRIEDRATDTRPVVTRTALVVPARHEEPGRLMAGLSAMLASLDATGEGEHFHIHLLSDTTDERLAEPEEAAWRDLLARSPHPERMHYRRRADNVGRKAGNIADFCARHVDDYDFMVVLDADSIMSGATLVALVRAMQSDPRAGLIQTVPIPARQETTFGRFIQFAGSVYSPVLATGQAFWQTDSANYWGHNAILRMRPFTEHCRLPVLSGEPPLGGPPLSHDFVEAALLRRAGWHVYLAPWLEGSHEEVPANILDYAKRDRRWAQGSLQHLRLLFERGLHPLSRVHFVSGAMGYLSSALWLLLLLASTAYVLAPGLSRNHWIGELGAAGVWMGGLGSPIPLLGLTAGILFLPKALGVVLAMTERRDAFGGAGRLLLGALLEALFAVLVAPLMMMYHSAFVVGILAGRDVAWGAQARQERNVSWWEAWRRTAPVTVLGAAWAAATLISSPRFFLWLTPILTGLLFAAPTVRWTSGARLGRWLRQRGVLVVPSETRTPPELLLPAEHGRAVRPIFPRAQRTRTGIAASTMHQIERGLFELRRGRPLCVVPERSASGTMTLFTSVEALDAAKLEELAALGLSGLRLVVTPLRARAMGVHVDSDTGRATGVSLRVNGETPSELLRLSSSLGVAHAARLEARAATDTEACALAMIRLSGLVPAVIATATEPARVPRLSEALARQAILTVDAEQVRALGAGLDTGIEITHVSDALVPLEEAGNARFMLFRESSGLLEHVAILIGERDTWPEAVPVRLHSACLTGDLFGSLRCDCGEQLRGSLRSFAGNGGGVLLYLQQEGRGIGLGNKLRAYALQEEGLDTVDADRVLGFGADERRYDAAVGILHHLGIRRVKLLTNNPRKVTALERSGIEVLEREPLHGTLNDHNLRYVRAKIQREGHWLNDMLHGAVPGA